MDAHPERVFHVLLYISESQTQIEQDQPIATQSSQCFVSQQASSLRVDYALGAPCPGQVSSQSCKHRKSRMGYRERTLPCESVGAQWDDLISAFQLYFQPDYEAKFQ